MSQRQHRVEITLPLDFLELCDSDMVSPKKVLCDFIADLCDITSQHPEHSKEYLSNGSADRDRASNERQFELPLGDNQREYPKIVVGAER